jgi:Family of unknown function (DUF5682)
VTPAASGTNANRILLLGVRHHGPGSARSVVTELDRVRPSVVLIEGPADADPLLGLAAAPGMSPPVALLGYAPDEPRVSAFWPYAEFSPEWQALLWAARAGVPARFCDLPAGAVLARAEPAGGTADEPERAPEPGGPAAGESRPARETGAAAAADREGEPGPENEGAEEAESRPRSESPAGFDFAADPIGALAAAAGYDDPERWWEDLVEARTDGSSPFPALTEAMGELRAGPAEASLPERRREAHMRQVLRGALKETDGVVAVVCGAWHAPALAWPLPPATADAALLRGLPKRKAALAWVPWTHSRLATASGYGAGITSPGWYHHVFATPAQTVERWLTRVAAVLRERDLPVSSAHVIEAVRLASALAVLRGRPAAGLAEVSEATLAVLCEGDQVVAGYVTRDLVVGELLGTVPPDAPPVPLDADLRARARALKLKISPLAVTLDLDLRRELDRGRSEFLHRLDALGIGFGQVTDSTVRTTGTFRETWTVRWQPSLSVAVIDAAVWGNTVAQACAARLIDVASSASALPAVTEAVSAVLLAGLSPVALAPVLRALEAVAALDEDVTSLMTAVPALVRAIRYGTVRGTPSGSLSAVVDALVIRVCAALPGSVGGLADDAAARLREAMDGLHAALAVYGPAGPSGSGSAAGSRERWMDALGGLAGRRDVHGLIAGRVTRMLADAGALAWAEAAIRFQAALSVGVPTAAKAAWAEGFLGSPPGGGAPGGPGAGGGLLLVHDADLLGVLDQWVGSLGAEEFVEVLPLLRRTFGGFTEPERAAIGRAARALGPPDGPGAGGGKGAGAGGAIDEARAAGVLRTVALILGGGGTGAAGGADGEGGAGAARATDGEGGEGSGTAARAAGSGYVAGAGR